MIFGKLDGDEARHGRFSLQSQNAPNCLEGSSDEIGGTRVEVFGDGWDPGAYQQTVDEFP